jgi:aspartyl-tRNA(Asn)/glutamyl-tRNA(Gln) amidotransferase subunit B
MGSLLAALNAMGRTIGESPVSAENLAALLELVQTDVISGKIAKTVFDEMAQTGKTPRQVVEEKGLVQITDSQAIEEVISRVLADNPDEVQAYRQGKTKLMGFFVGQVMRATKGKANPKLVNEILKEKLG